MKSIRAFVAMFSCISVANWAHSTIQPEYLEVNAENRYSTVYGDGYETGFKVSFEFFALRASNQPIVELPGPDNSADCELIELKMTSERQVGSGRYSMYHRIYTAKITTSVEADTGGCLVLVKDANNAHLKFVDYYYATDF